MRILLNGRPHETNAQTIGALIEELALGKGTALVEQNGIALRAAEWTRPLAADDRIEVLRIAAGG